MSKAEMRALKWLMNRGGSGVFQRNQTLLAGGDIAPVMRATWKRLINAGLLVLAKPRLEVTPAGRAVDLTGVTESDDGGRSEEFWGDR